MKRFRFITAGDLALILILLGCSAAFLLFTGNTYAGSRHVVVRVSGRSVLELPLEQNTTRTVTGPCGDTVVVIEDGKARVTESACPNHVCIDMGSISHPGELIVCVPNKVIVTIRGSGNQDQSFDGVTQ
jgi:hypothetical protein